MKTRHRFTGSLSARLTGLAFSVGVLTGCAELAAPAGSPPTLEYLGHAAFVVEWSGTRIVIDPYNSERWLGYSFPADVEANAVLITHPHYDHDASYHFPATTPVFRAPGFASVGEIRVEGYEGRHADPYGRDFGQINTVWVVEAGGVRIAHLGDNGPLSSDLIAAMGRVDVLLTPADDQEHILKNAEIDAIRAALQPRLTIPMHYRLEGFRDLPASLGPLDATVLGAEPLGRERVALHQPILDMGALALRPSGSVRPWTDELARAWDARDEGRDVLSGDSPNWELAARSFTLATELAPEVLIFKYELAGALIELGFPDRAIVTLEQGLANAAQQDTEYGMRARARLAELYAAEGRDAEAAALYRAILAGSTRLALLDAARTFLQR